jgi:hypothetical protein
MRRPRPRAAFPPSGVRQRGEPDAERLPAGTGRLRSRRRRIAFSSVWIARAAPFPSPSMPRIGTRTVAFMKPFDHGVAPFSRNCTGRFPRTGTCLAAAWHSDRGAPPSPHPPDQEGIPSSGAFCRTGCLRRPRRGRTRSARRIRKAMACATGANDGAVRRKSCGMQTGAGDRGDVAPILIALRELFLKRPCLLVERDDRPPGNLAAGRRRLDTEVILVARFGERGQTRGGGRGPGGTCPRRGGRGRNGLYSSRPSSSRGTSQGGWSRV